MQKIDCFAHAGIAPALRSGLADALVTFSSLDDAPAFADVVADRLLNVDMLAGLETPDGRQGVPVVGGRDADNVDRLVVEDAADVLLVLRGLVLGPFGGRHRLADHRLIAIADGGDNAIVLAGIATDISAALTVDADHGHVERIVGISLLGRFHLRLVGAAGPFSET